MLNYLIPKRKWHLKLFRGDGLIVIAAPFLGERFLFTEALEKMYLGKEKVVFSQFVDTDQWNFGDKYEFESRIVARHSVNISFTSSYIEKKPPQVGEKVFILNGLGSPKIELLNEVLRFGMTNLSNIVYEYGENISNWLSKTTAWNRVFLDWYQFKIPDSSLIEITSQTGLVSWTSDYYLSFCITNIEQLTQSLGVFHNLASKNRLSLIIETEKINRI